MKHTALLLVLCVGCSPAPVPYQGPPAINRTVDVSMSAAWLAPHIDAGFALLAPEGVRYRLVPETDPSMRFTVGEGCPASVTGGPKYGETWQGRPVVVLFPDCPGNVLALTIAHEAMHQLGVWDHLPEGEAGIMAAVDPQAPWSEADHALLVSHQAD
jgi:hypothetical protein